MDPTKAKILKQINKVNSDGSYTFGYENDDGTFKVETRSKDGVVKGKYGFLDASGKLKTVEYSAGEKASKSKSERGDQTMASATDSKVVAPKPTPAEDDGNYNDKDGQDFKAQQQRNVETIDRQDDGQSQYLRQVGAGGGRDEPSRYNPTTQLAGGRFNNPEDQEYKTGGVEPGSSQYDGQGQGQFIGGPQSQFVQDPEGFSPGQLQQFVGSQPSQLSGPPRRFLGQSQYLGGQGLGRQPQYLGGQGQTPQYLGSQDQNPQYLGGQGQQLQQYTGQQFAGSPQQQEQYSQFPQQQYVQSQSPYLAGQQQQQYLGNPARFSQQQFNAASPGAGAAGAREGAQLVGGIGRPDLQNYDPNEQSQYSGATGFGGPNRFSSGARFADELGFARRPAAAVGSGGSTQEYVPSVELDGFSEDADQDGYVDPYPGSKNGDAKTAQAAEKTAAVKTPDGEKVTVTPGAYNPQALGPQYSQHFPEGQIQGGQSDVSPYDEQTLRQIYQQQGSGQSFPISPQVGGFLGQSQFQGSPLIPQGQPPYPGQGIGQSQPLFAGQGGVIQSQSPYPGQEISSQGQPQFQGQFPQGQPQFSTQGQPDFQGIQGNPQFQGGRPQFGQGAGGQPQFVQGGQPQFVQGLGGQSQFAPGGQPQFVQGQGNPSQLLPGIQPQFVQSQGGQSQFAQGGQPQLAQGGQPQFVQEGQPQLAQGGQPQFGPQGQQFSPTIQGVAGPQQFSPAFQGGAGPQQFFSGSPQGQYLGGGFQPHFGSQGGPIPPHFFQGGRGQQFAPSQGPSPYAGGIQSAGFPFDYSPYAGIGPGGFEGSPNYPQQIPGQSTGSQISPSPSKGSAKSDDDGEEKKDDA